VRLCARDASVVCGCEVGCQVLCDRRLGSVLMWSGVVGWEVAVQCCGVEGGRGH